MHEVADGKEEFANTKNVEEVNATVRKLKEVLAACKISTQHGLNILRDSGLDGGGFQFTR